MTDNTKPINGYIDREKQLAHSQSPDGDVRDTSSHQKEALANNATESSDGGSSAQAVEEHNGVKDYFRIFIYTDRFDRLLYAIACIAAIAAGATLPLMTLVFGSTISSFTATIGQGPPPQFQQSINQMVLYFVYLFVGRFVVGYVGTLCACIAATRTTNSLRKVFLAKLLRQEISYFEAHDNGSVITQITTNGNRINQGIAEKLYTCVVGASLLVSSFVVALAVQWKLALITLSILPAIVVAVGGCVGLDAPIEARIVKTYSRAATIAQDALGSIKTICAFGAEQTIVDHYDEFLRSAWKEGQKKSIIYGVLFSSQNFLTMGGTALAFWEGSRLYRSGEIPDVGTVFTVVLSVTLGASSVVLLLPQFLALTNASSAASELFTVIDRPSQLDPLASHGVRPSTCVGEIEFRELQFAYPSRPMAPVLRGLNLSIPAGKTTALVGPSGCGKSTLVGLLERWYQPTSGQILLDGQDITGFNTGWLRDNIRLVQQEPTLFQGTVFHNVANGLVGEQKNLSETEKIKLVQDACKAADAHEFIEKLPDGYYTQLGEGARMLSGGQRQRVAIARSIISNPTVLLCDEATSALDPRAERVVQDALSRVSTGRTALVIAHKLATVMKADNIAVMASGKVVEQGTHSELLELDGLYAAMVRAQDLGADEDNSTEIAKDKKGISTDTLDEQCDQDIALQRTQSRAMMIDNATKREVERLSAGSARYSLAKCVWVMLREHPDMYKWYALIVAAYIVLGATYPAQALIFSGFIEAFSLQGSEGVRQANFYSLLFFVVAIGNLVGFFCVGVSVNSIGQTLTYRVRREMLERMLRMDQDFFDRPENSSAALTGKLSSVPSGIQELMSGNIGLMLNVMINILVTSVFGIAFGWKLGLTLVATGIFIIIGSGYLRIKLDQKLDARTEKQFSDSASIAAEAVGSIKTVSLLTLENSVLHEYSKALDEIMAKVIRSLIPMLIPYSFSQSADFLVLALGFWYGSRLVASGEYSTKQFFVIFIVIVFGDQAAAQFFTWTTSITKGKAGANYLLWLRTIQAEIRETDENKDRGPTEDKASVKLEQVEFAYKQRESGRVLRGISLNIEPGTFAAFVGPSGCGKSTIISLLQRFYDPTSGRIMLNGEDISRMSPRLLRRALSLVQQEPPLYLGSVRENIAIGLDYDPSEEEVHEACRQANVLEFVSSLPEGLNTACGSKGLQLSGGQRQRIALARALIRKPRLLLLDEATSALDTQSERVVQKALDEAASSRTTIAVAHRLSTIRHANVIFVIEDGKIVETGTHDELQQLRGRYHAMCLAQSLDQAY